MVLKLGRAQGAASKEQVQLMLEKTLGVKLESRHLDATDALAIALCHHYETTSPIKSAKGKGGWERFFFFEAIFQETRRLQGKKKTGTSKFFWRFRFCAQSGNRTRTTLLSQDFESSASTNSAIRACRVANVR